MVIMERLQFKIKHTSMMGYWVRMESLWLVFLVVHVHVNGRTELNVFISFCKNSFKVLQVIVSFCFISLKSTSEESDTGTVLMVLLMIIFILAGLQTFWFQLALQTSSSQILPALVNLLLCVNLSAEDVPEPSPIEQY